MEVNIPALSNICLKRLIVRPVTSLIVKSKQPTIIFYSRVVVEKKDGANHKCSGFPLKVQHVVCLYLRTSTATISSITGIFILFPKSIF